MYLLKFNLIKGDEVIKLCVSNQFIEQQAYDFSEQIRENSLYKFVGVEISENNPAETNVQKRNELALISHVILEDNDGSRYYVAPNPNGLRFAKKEITHKEYNKQLKKETRNAVITFLAVLVFFGVTMLTIVQLLI